MFRIIQSRKIWFTLSGTLCLLSILALLFWGLSLGIDFTGGSLLEIKFADRVLTNDEISASLSDLELPYLNIQPTSNNGVILKTKTLTEAEHREILKRILTTFGEDLLQKAEGLQVSPEMVGLSGEGLENLKITATGETADYIKGEQGLPALNPEITSQYYEELRFDSIGPTIGKELQQKAIYAILIVIIAIILYIAYAFRKVSHPIESWKYGVAAVIALIHDILIVTGIFSALGHFFGYQVDTLFITALLTILGFSVHDTIVTFDRTRENLHRHQDQIFEDVINSSVNETLTRSLNTSITTFFALLAIYLFGGQSLKEFILALMIGIIFGTYSSIFLASPLLMVWYRFKKY